VGDLARTLDRDAAWNAESSDRERREGTLVLLLAATLVPAWIAFDVLLEPELVRPFAVIRAAGSAIALALLIVLRRARTVGAVRGAIAATLLLVGSCIGLMLPHVEHFAAYLFGFSLFFWASGALLSWPATYAMVVFAWLLGVLVAGLVAWPAARSVSDFVMAGFHLVSAAAIGSGMTLVRRKTLRTAFEASFALEQRNAELASALERLGDAQARLVASEKLSALGRLLGGLSHEINNPMNVLQNNMEPVRRHIESLLELVRLATSARPEELAAVRARSAELDVAWIGEDLQDATETMRTAIERIRQVHRDLRAFIRGDAPEMQVGDVNEGLRSTVALVTRRGAEGLRVEVSLAELPDAAFQPGQLNQVWHNLIQNALDATGGRGRLWISSRLERGCIEVSVADDGPGVAEHCRPRLFEPFFTTKEIGKGTGLGLATCYQIVERHGGTIFLDAGHRPGAKFVVRLPIRRSEPAPRVMAAG
jgi:signal transduction histidine kinase